MQMLEIKPCGDVFYDGELVGRITFEHPLLGRFIAGEFHADCADQDWSGCPYCDEAKEKADDFAAQLVVANKGLANLSEYNSRLTAENHSLHLKLNEACGDG